MTALLPYLPIDRRQSLAHGQSLPPETSGATLLAHISGFSLLTQRLTPELGRKRSAAQLQQHLNTLFQVIISHVHQYGGSVISLAGHSLTCWFANDHGPASRRALTCALAIQASLSQLTTADSTAIELGLKIAIAAGSARRFLVGNPHICVLEAFAGATLDSAALAQNLAQPGEIIASQETVSQCHDGLIVATWREDEETGQRFALVSDYQLPSPPTPWAPLPAHTLSRDTLEPWLLPDIATRLRSDQALASDLRPVTAVFLHFTGLDFTHDPQAADNLNQFIRWAQAIIHSHGGNLLQLSLGDKNAALCAVFGAPLAHEDDTQRAIAAALSLQTTPAEMPFITSVQIGINRGEVWAGICGTGNRQAYNVLGAEINLAARLMVRAAPGQILVSGRIQQEPTFRYQYIGDIFYKGFSNLVPTYRLIGAKSVTEKIFSHPLFGREAELAQLQQAVAPLFDGRSPSSAIIHGPAGIGKSHLAYELQQSLAQRVTWFTVQTDPIAAPAFHPFIYFLKTYFRQTTTATTDQNKDNFKRRLHALRTALKQKPPTAQQKALRQELERAESTLGALLGLHWPDSPYQSLKPPERYQNSRQAIKTVLLAESYLHPVVFALEDGHWLDPASRALLPLLTQPDSHFPLFLLITSRLNTAHEPICYPLDEATTCQQINLDMLSATAVRQYASALLQAPIHDTLHAFLLQKTQGHPFFVQQLLTYLQKNNWLNQDAGQWTLPTPPPNLPSTLTAVLSARLNQLTPAIKELVQAASVLGREFDVRLLAQVVQARQITAVLPYIQQAEKEQIWAAISDLHYVFKHSLLRDVAYAMQPPARLQELHGLTAVAIETLYAPHLNQHYAALTHHYHHAANVSQESHYALLAGEQALSQFDHETALVYFDRVLKLLPTDALLDQFYCLLQRERIYHHTAQREAQAMDLVRLSTLAQALSHNPLITTVALRMAAYYEALGDYSAAKTAVQRSLQLARQDHDIRAEIQALLQWADICQHQAQTEKRLELLQTILNLTPLIAAEFPQESQAAHRTASRHLDNALPN